MAYPSLEACLLDLESKGQLVRVRETVDPYLQMAAIHLRVHAADGPALLFEKIKGSQFRAASNIFGTIERSKIIFDDTLTKVQRVIDLKNNPLHAFKKPLQNASLAATAFRALPLKNPASKPVLYQEIKIEDLPLITHWPKDGGAFVTLPQVYTEDADKPGIMHANLGMYRIQLSGNEYILNNEVGLHYQIHRGIGVHQTKANQLGKPLKVSIFVGGPPAHSVAAVMPLPEGMSEMTFAGLLGGRRFRYLYKDGYCISTDADFVITGEVHPQANKPEGPFGDHLGYYSLKHDFPLMKIHKVYARKNAIWAFTVVGRPPQEDSSFGELIHEITGNALQAEIPGLKEVYAVDASGVHPLLLAIGSERYTPYAQTKQPSELLTIANHILGKGQLSLAKFLFITTDDTNQLAANKPLDYFTYFLERINLQRDLHFYTNTSIDTLDYSGTGLNMGSKLVLAAHGDKLRELAQTIPESLKNIPNFQHPTLAMPGVVVLQTLPFSTYENAAAEMNLLNEILKTSLDALQSTPLIVIADDAQFVSENFNNFLWVSFTRCNPSHDVYGIDSFTKHKHWGCKGPMLLDARVKPHHAPVLEKDPDVEKSIDYLFEKGGSLYGII